jgi:tetratricopeptide (TPR) repeat protein
MQTVSTPLSILKMKEKQAPMSDALSTDPERLWQAAAEVLLASGDHRQLAAFCDVMLAHRPNHLDALYYRARLAMARGDHAAAQPLFERVLKSDPEHWAARFAFGTLQLAHASTTQQGLARCLEAVTQGATLKPQVQKSIPSGIAPKSITLRPAEMQEQWESAYQAVVDAAGKSLSEKYTDLPREQLVAMLMLESLGAGGALGSGRRLAHKLADDQPQLVKPRLLLAEWYTAEGDIASGMNYFHDAKVLDPGGRVARRLTLPMLTVAYSATLPDAVASSLSALSTDVKRAAAEVQGWQAPAPLDKQVLTAKHVGVAKRRSNSATLTPSATAVRVQHDLNKWQQRLFAPKNQRTQVPTAEIVVTARQPFVKLYGVAAAESILEETSKLVSAINQTNRIHAHLVILDDMESVKSWGTERVEGSHAAGVKRAIDQVEQKIEAMGEQASYVLIVGGDAVVPFHRLPNPVDDHDPYVPSDNPYAANGEEYLIPTRAVGRLPHDRTSPALILDQLRRLQAAWRGTATDPKGGWMTKVSGRAAKVSKGEGWGYAAEIWGAAAKEVYKVLDSKSALNLCPPLNETQWAKEAIPPLPFYYFNLHGVEENGNYYGQAADPRAKQDELYPTALTPAQFAQLALTKAVLFSEACYGANPKADTPATSLALTALQKGATLFVGSTNTSYASFKPPLMAADLLAALFWKAISEGLPGGAALQQAKIELARTMQNPNDYVDVEEQKALLSFVLYGDPALPLDNRPRHADTSGLRQTAKKAMAESHYQVAAKSMPNQNLDPALQKAVLSYVAPYTQAAGATPKVLARPIGFTDAPPTLSSFFSPTATLAKSNPGRTTAKSKEKWHVTVSQPISKDGVLHQKVITLTMDDKGKVVKSHTSK